MGKSHVDMGFFSKRHVDRKTTRLQGVIFSIAVD